MSVIDPKLLIFWDNFDSSSQEIVPIVPIPCLYCAFQHATASGQPLLISLVTIDIPICCVTEHRPFPWLFKLVAFSGNTAFSGMMKFWCERDENLLATECPRKICGRLTARTYFYPIAKQTLAAHIHSTVICCGTMKVFEFVRTLGAQLYLSWTRKRCGRPIS